MLGFLCNHHGNGSTLLRTTATSSPLQHGTRSHWRPLDARHGRVLLRLWKKPTRKVVLIVWDPITDVRQELPVLPWRASSCTATILCAAGAGACDHHDCHLGSFLVVFVGTDPRNMFVSTYDSADYFPRWSKPISVQHPNDCYIYSAGCSPPVLLRNQLYFGIPTTNTVLQYDLELREISWIQLPTMHYCYQRSVLTTTKDGLGLVSITDGKLCVWLRMNTPGANAGWTQIKADLTLSLHIGPVMIKEAFVVGFADGLDTVFVTVADTLLTIDLRTYTVKNVYCGRAIHTVFPYMRFYSPALEAACLGDEEQCSWI